ncbi:calcineurin-like phosphoesterase family protein [Paraperlucidibaca baekdonensis]|uniref:Calcineurin-like phosphoesterase family protein n=1 Tax=Paraperlucidibaca baekdonensis TaxID=748120 RepID=A0A3E0H987_9GAMM|nr:metallophosphoesterase [Paraperlucidibaca baekdonensis]REH40268.1 calcineurin-like phosphoesterase family protein [Paraperlucidibaca baekdonensis]
MRFLVPALTCASLLLAACGGNSSGSFANTSADARPPSVTPPATTPDVTPDVSTPTANRAANCTAFAPDAFVTRNELASGQRVANAALMLRFLHYTDDHIIDDEGQTVNGLGVSDPINPLFESAQRLQEEYSDEVLNNMIGRSNDCLKDFPASFMIVTGDSADLTTLSETRRFIDNLDGTFDQLSAFEKSCVANFPAGTPAFITQQACTRFTGRGVPDSQSPDPDIADPSFQFTLTRTLRQIVNQLAAQLGRDVTGATDPTRQTLTQAPGLPQVLRCSEGDEGCENSALKTPWYVAFGNHDGYLRGTVPVGIGINEASFLTTGRRHIVQPKEFIQEFFETSSLPVGHGFNMVDAARRDDNDKRNDGYYAFTSGNFRMIVLSTVIDGTDPRLPTDLIRNPFALADGTVDRSQFEWMKAELDKAYKAKQLVMVFSHHPDLAFAEFGMFAAAVPLDLTAAELDAELASYPNVVAWLAGHTHIHRVRPFVVTATEDGALTGSNGEINTPVVCKKPGVAADGLPHCRGFWQVETASLIDFPQEQRLIEVFDNGNGTGTLRGPVLTHSFERSRVLAEADDRCQFYLLDPNSLQKLSSDGGLDAVCSFGMTRQGTALDRNVELMFRLPRF